MKLKTLPASCEASSALPRSLDVAPLQLEADRRTSIAASARPDPFHTFARKFVANHDLPAVGSDTSTVNGTIVAEAHVDGVRYVMLRCAPKPNEAFLTLSPRERDIVNLITKGYPNKMIAELLDISAWTVGTHLRRIFAKLGVTSRAAMVARYLHQNGETHHVPTAIVIKDPLRVPVERA